MPTAPSQEKIPKCRILPMPKTCDSQVGFLSSVSVTHKLRTILHPPTQIGFPKMNVG